MNIKDEVTHIGETENGTKMYLRKNKWGQWVTIRSTRKGYRWDALDLLTEYPVSSVTVSKKQLEDFVL